jgi:hypothetical protein
MTKNSLRALFVLCVLGASASVIGCTEDCVDGYCVPAYDYGYYYDSLVSGVAYSTETEDGITRTGVTGEDNDPGRFSYFQENATVSFSIGDTALGESTAKDKVTPFDFAGIAEEAVGGCDVSGTLPDDGGPFQIVHNLAVLLQTMDTDGDPSNGIDISADVAALFEGVSVNVDQTWEAFQADTDLLGVLEAANADNLLGEEARGLVAREDALKALYEGIGLCPAQS